MVDRRVAQLTAGQKSIRRVLDGAGLALASFDASGATRRWSGGARGLTGCMVGAGALTSAPSRTRSGWPSPSGRRSRRGSGATTAIRLWPATRSPVPRAASHARRFVWRKSTGDRPRRPPHDRRPRAAARLFRPAPVAPAPAAEVAPTVDTAPTATKTTAETRPDATVPDATVPDATVPDATVPRRGRADACEERACRCGERGRRLRRFGLAARLGLYAQAERVARIEGLALMAPASRLG